MKRFSTIVIAVVAFLLGSVWQPADANPAAGPMLTPPPPLALIFLAAAVTLLYFVAVMLYDRRRYDRDRFSRHGR